MSPQKSTDLQEEPTPLSTGAYRKPRADLYTVLLVVALVAVLIGILFLYLEMSMYEFKLEGGPPIGSVVVVSGQYPASEAVCGPLIQSSLC